MIKIKDKNGEQIQKNKLNEIKIIFTDLDGTLLNSKHRISDSDLNSLIKAKNKGIKIFFATGRSRSSMERIIGDQIRKSNINLCSGIYLNGSIIYNDDGLLLFDEKITNDIKMEILDCAKKLNIYEYVAWQDSQKTYSHAKNYNLECLEEIENDTIELITEKKLKEMNIYKAIICLDEKDYERSINLLREKLSNKMTIVRTYRFYIEIFNKYINKFEGVKKICELYNINLSNTLVIGDGENDIEMLKGSPNSVSLINASNNVKQYANYIGPSNDENCITHVLEAFCGI